MFRTQSNAVKLARCLLLLSLAYACARAPHRAHARQTQTPSATPQQTPRTGRSYESGAPARRPPAPAPQSQSPVTFTDITAQSGVTFRHAASPTSQKYLPETMGGGVALFDYDNDGRLDIFFTNGAALQDPMPKGASPDKRDPRFWNRLYHQKADGTFEDVSARAGVADPEGKSLGVAFADFDGDGFVDVFVANDNARQFLFRNKGDGTFEDVALLAGVGYDENGKSFAGMGVDAADYDNDGLVDIFVTALSNETYPLFRNNGDMTFAYATSSAGVSAITIPYSGWGARFCDFDSDGLRDIFVAQGHVLDTIEKTTGFLTYKQTPLLMRNNGKGFVNVSASAGLNVPLAARGAAFGDIDNDGDTDVVLAETDGPPVILRNNGTKNHWLGLALVGAKGNRQALGARLTVTDSSGGRQIFDVTAAGSYLSSNDPRVVVGLGSKTGVRSVEVRWPDGRMQTVQSPAIDQYLSVKEK